jgi:hypothetical protein
LPPSSGDFGSTGLRIVGTRADACRLLGLSDPTFESLQLS